MRLHNRMALPLRRTPWTPRRLGSSLTNWLPMDAGAGATTPVVRDRVPGAAPTYRGNDGTVEASDPTWTAEGLHFDGGDYCNQLGTHDLAAGSGLSVMVAVNPTATGVHQALFTLESLASTDPVVLFRIYSNGSGSPHLLVRDDATNSGSVTGTFTTDGAWHTHGFTLRLGGTAKTYVDGALDNSGSLAAVGDITLGRQALGAWVVAGAGYFLTCSMAYAVVVQSELTAAQMKTLHNYIRRQVAGRGISLAQAT